MVLFSAARVQNPPPDSGDPLLGKSILWMHTRLGSRFHGRPLHALCWPLKSHPLSIPVR